MELSQNMIKTPKGVSTPHLLAKFDNRKKSSRGGGIDRRSSFKKFQEH